MWRGRELGWGSVPGKVRLLCADGARFTHVRRSSACEPQGSRVFRAVPVGLLGNCCAIAQAGFGSLTVFAFILVVAKDRSSFEFSSNPGDMAAQIHTSDPCIPLPLHLSSEIKSKQEEFRMPLFEICIISIIRDVQGCGKRFKTNRFHSFLETVETVSRKQWNRHMADRCLI